MPYGPYDTVYGPYSMDDIDINGAKNESENVVVQVHV